MLYISKTLKRRSEDTSLLEQLLTPFSGHHTSIRQFSQTHVRRK